MAPIFREGEGQIGWGGTCGRHADAPGARALACKKHLTYGSGHSALQDTECKDLVKQWLIEGQSIAEDRPMGRRDHLVLNPRHFSRRSSAELEAELHRAYPASSRAP